MVVAKNKSAPILLRIQKDQLDQLRVIADREQRSIAQLIRFAIDAYLEAQDFTPPKPAKKRSAK